MKHAIVWAVIVSVVATNTACRKQVPTPVQAPLNTTQTYTMSDGLRITPLEVETDEIANILGIQQWRFRVVTPSDQDRLQHRVELREPGKPDIEVNYGVMWTMGGRDKEMVVAFYPIAGELNTAEKVKTYIRIGGGTSSRIWDSPFKGLGGSSRSPLATKQEDESLLLMEFSQSGNHPDPNGTRLVLTLKIAEPEEKRP